MGQVCWRPSQFRLYLLAIMSADTLQISGFDAGIKLRPTNEELLSMSPEFNHRWSTHFANAPDKPVMLIVPIAAYVHLFPINQTLN